MGDEPLSKAAALVRSRLLGRGAVVELAPGPLDSQRWRLWRSPAPTASGRRSARPSRRACSRARGGAGALQLSPRATLAHSISLLALKPIRNTTTNQEGSQ